MSRSAAGHSVLVSHREQRTWSQTRLAHEITKVAAERRQTVPNLDTLVQTISRWERGHRHPTQFYRELLCAVFGASTVELFGEEEAPCTDEGSLAVTSHKFVPAWVGPERAANLTARYGSGTVTVGGLQADCCDTDWARLYVFPFGVVVAHLREEMRFPSIAALAVWRRGSHKTALIHVTEQLRQLTAAENDGDAPEADYVLSALWLHTGIWADSEQLGVALRLLSMPSILLDRERLPDPIATRNGELAERRLLRTGFDHDGIANFGVQATSLGYASWAGVAYHPLAAHRALHEDDLVDCEIAAQALWSYCNRLLSCPELSPEEPYGPAFLRACQTAINFAGAREPMQRRLLREAILTTSRLPDLLASPHETLRYRQLVA